MRSRPGRPPGYSMLFVDAHEHGSQRAEGVRERIRCGICVIGMNTGHQTPMVEPTPTPMSIQVQVKSRSKAGCPPRPSSMPVSAWNMPRRALSGWLSPSGQNEEDRRRQVGGFAKTRLSSRFMACPPVFPLEHAQHPVGDQKTADTLMLRRSRPPSEDDGWSGNRVRRAATVSRRARSPTMALVPAISGVCRVGETGRSPP